MSDWIDQITFNAQGLVPAIAQDFQTGRVLMVAWMNREALEQTAATGEVVYFSRSRNALWRKGETSGSTQRLVEMRLDCDADVLLLQVEQRQGIACHTGRESCFFSILEAAADGPLGGSEGSKSQPTWRVVDPVLVDPENLYGQGPRPALAPGDVLARLADTIAQRRSASPEQSYVAKLLSKAPDGVLKKIGEEATELVMASKDNQPSAVVAEMADLWFHCLVLLEQQGLRPEQVLSELARREGLSGIEEKANRREPSR